MRKIILISFAFLFLGVVFFLSEKRNEDGLSEVNYWKITPEEIRYFPPKSSSEFSKFISTELIFKKIETGMKSSPIFSVHGIDSGSKENYVYEGNYNIKNLFTDISALSVKSINPAKQDLLEKFQISTEKSPALEILKASKVEKKIYLGEEVRDKSRRYLLSDKDIITAPTHIFYIFSNPPADLRDRQYLRFGEFELSRLQFQGDGIHLTIENNPETKNGIKNRKWFKIANGKFRVDPAVGDTLFSYLQYIKADLYPDESDGEGFLVSKELVSTESIAQLDVFFQNGLHYKIKLFPKAVLKNRSYYPVLKEVENFFVESPSYASELSVMQTIDLLKKIQSAPEWSEPKGK
jgi:hypothetical protein